MKLNLDRLTTDLAEYESRCGFDQSESILDFLWYCYSASNPIDDGRIRATEEKLDPVFQDLSYEASNSLFDLISERCLVYQRAAYFEGLGTGFRLSQELNGT